MYQYYKETESWLPRVPIVLAKQDGSRFKNLDDVETAQSRNMLYFYGFHVDELIGGELVELWHEEDDDEAAPIPDNIFYMYINGNWETNINYYNYCDPLLYITKQDGSDWNSIEELNASDTKYYS
jgi:hypothetical protein